MASGYTGAAMNKQVRRIHSILAHPGPSPLLFFEVSVTF